MNNVQIITSCLTRGALDSTQEYMFNLNVLLIDHKMLKLVKLISLKNCYVSNRVIVIHFNNYSNNFKIH